MNIKRVYPCVPDNCVEIILPRLLFPEKVTVGEDNRQPWDRVDNWSLVVCPSETVVRVDTGTNRYDYAAVWSLLSDKVYSWMDYYYGDLSTRSRVVNDKELTVACMPDMKSHHNKPQSVYLYTTASGVIRIIEKCYKERRVLVEEFPQSLYELEDCAFAVYLDKVEESELFYGNKLLIKRLIKVFFGLVSVS